MLQTMQPFFMRSRFSLTTTFLLPGEDMTERNLKEKKPRKYQLKRECESVLSLLTSKYNLHSWDSICIYFSPTRLFETLPLITSHNSHNL